MAEIIDFADAARCVRDARSSGRDPEKAEVFPGVSLADLWRLWAASERAKRLDPEERADQDTLAG